MKVKIGKYTFTTTKAQTFVPFQINNSTADIQLITRFADIFGIKSTVDFDSFTKGGQQDMYDKSQIISSIIDRKGEFLISGDRVFTDVNNKTVDKGIEYNNFSKLVFQPNVLMDGDEFDKIVNAYLHTFGFCPLYRIYPPNRTSGNPIAVFPIFPLYFQYFRTGKMFYQNSIGGIIKSVTFSAFGLSELITLSGDQLNDIMILNYGSPSRFDYYTAQSPLYSLGDLASLFNISVQVYGQLVERSILGMVSAKSDDKTGPVVMGSNEKSDIQARLGNYGLTKSKDQIILTDKNLFWQSMLSNVNNLQLPAAILECIDAICDKLNFQKELLAKKQSTFENKTAAERSQYQNATIPFSDMYYRQLSKFLNPTGTLTVKRDYSKLPIFTEDRLSEGEATFKYANAFAALVGTGKFSDQELELIKQNFKLIQPLNPDL